MGRISKGVALTFALTVMQLVSAEVAPVCYNLMGLAAAKGSQSVFNVYIDGAFRPSSSARTQPVIAPFNGSTVYEVPVCTREEIDEVRNTIS